jgi:hypothetical protein
MTYTCVYMPKEKLTLTVDSEVVKKAKSLGLNISDLSELALRGFTFGAKGAESSALYKAYGDLFEAMKPLLQQYDASVKIASQVEVDEAAGSYEEVQEYLLLSDGTFFADSAEVQFGDITKIPTGAFLPPKEILSNFIDSLARAAARRKETMKELEMVKRIISAIASTMQGRTGAKVGTKNRRKRALGHA